MALCSYLSRISAYNVVERIVYAYLIFSAVWAPTCTVNGVFLDSILTSIILGMRIMRFSVNFKTGEV